MSLDMEYNSAREILIFPEYGRNIQKLIQHARTIDNVAMKQHFIETIVDLMQQMNPQSRNLDDYRDKLWKHVFRIADFELDGVVPPNGKIPTEEEAFKKPDPIGYPDGETKYRHYGSNVQRLIKKALSMEPGPKREGFVRVIGSYMKLAYRTWNKEHFVSDDVIKNDLEALSGGKLSLDEETSIDQLTQTGRRSTGTGPTNGSTGRRSSNGGSNGKSYRGKGGGSRGRRKG